jgi:hypothetical protein
MYVRVSGKKTQGDMIKKNTSSGVTPNAPAA